MFFLIGILINLIIILIGNHKIMKRVEHPKRRKKKKKVISQWNGYQIHSKHIKTIRKIASSLKSLGEVHKKAPCICFLNQAGDLLQILFYAVGSFSQNIHESIIFSYLFTFDFSSIFIELWQLLLMTSIASLQGWPGQRMGWEGHMLLVT